MYVSSSYDMYVSSSYDMYVSSSYDMYVSSSYGMYVSYCGSNLKRMNESDSAYMPYEEDTYMS
jgi:hypothetical protein